MVRLLRHHLHLLHLPRPLLSPLSLLLPRIPTAKNQLAALQTSHQARRRRHHHPLPLPLPLHLRQTVKTRLRARGCPKAGRRFGMMSTKCTTTMTKLLESQHGRSLSTDHRPWDHHLSPRPRRRPRPRPLPAASPPLGMQDKATVSRDMTASPWSTFRMRLRDRLRIHQCRRERMRIHQSMSTHRIVRPRL